MSQKSPNVNRGFLTKYCFPNKRIKSHYKSKTNNDIVVTSQPVVENSKENVLVNNNDKTLCTYSNQENDSDLVVEDSIKRINTIPIKVINLTAKCSCRVRQVIKLIQTDGIRKDDLIKSLAYTVELMDAIANEEQINITDEDDINVNSDGVPGEIREWLTSTFSTSVGRVSKTEKPKFRAVANAIRAGIMVEKGNHSYKIHLRVSLKIFKKSNEIAALKIPSEISKFLRSDINEWSFDIFKLDDISGGHSLRFIGLDLFLRYNFIHKYKINLQYFDNYFQALEDGYSKYGNPYHNLVHGADVAQTVHYMIYTYQLSNWLTDIQIFAVIFAALIHDFEHTGTTNNFHINTNSDLTLLYNDRGVLENHHVSSCFRLMHQPNFNLLKNLDKDDYREFRAMVIEMVLNTDMSTHFKQMKSMKSHLTLEENLDKGSALSMILHCADISHPAKDWSLHYRWTTQLLEEFFRQGDQESNLELPFSPLCDRKNILIPESQVGFSNFIVEPSFNILGNMIDFISKLVMNQGIKLNLKEDQNKSVAQNIPIKDSTPYPWEAKILINRSIWQKKIEQSKEEKEKLEAVQGEDDKK